MRLALEQAAKAQRLGEVPVGCVFVGALDHQKRGVERGQPEAQEQDFDESRIIARAHNLTNVERNGTRHCEMICVDQVLGWRRSEHDENENLAEVGAECPEVEVVSGVGVAKYYRSLPIFWTPFTALFGARG